MAAANKHGPPIVLSIPVVVSPGVILAETGISLGLWLALTFVAYQSFDVLRPCDVVMTFRFVAAVAAGTLALGGAVFWTNVRFIARRWVGFALCNIILSLALGWMPVIWAVTWADVALDEGPSHRIDARVLGNHYRSTGRYSSGRTYFAGVDIASTDPEVGQMMLARKALPGSTPPAGTAITMNLHPGHLGVPWVDGVDWSIPLPPSAPMRHLSPEELSALLARMALGRELKAAVEQIDRVGGQCTNDPP